MRGQEEASKLEEGWPREMVIAFYRRDPELQLCCPCSETETLLLLYIQRMLNARSRNAAGKLRDPMPVPKTAATELCKWHSGM